MPRPRKPKVNRGPKGRGSIFPDHRRGGWRAKVPAGRDPVSGRLRYKHFHAPTQAEVRALADAWLPPPTGISLSDWSRRWLASLDVREQSAANYQQNLDKRILPSLGALAVAAITPFHVEEAARAWGTRVGAATVRLTLATLSACLQAACRAEVVSRNAARVVKRPKATPPPFDLFTATELRLIIDRALPDPKLHPFAVCAAVGCRIGEALALEPGDYNPQTGELSITRTVVRNRKGKKGTGPPKSDNGIRTIRVPALLAPALARVPVTRSYDTSEGRWRALLAELGLRHRGSHQMKHSVSSLLVAKGVPVADAAKYVGDSIQVFLRTYVHPTGFPVVDAIAGWLGGAKVAREGRKPRKGKRPGRAPNLTR